MTSVRPTPLLRVRDVGWDAGTVSVLRAVSFDIAAGELVALMGKNGAGKSTLLDIIAGLRVPTTGAAHIAGVGDSSVAAPEAAKEPQRDMTLRHVSRRERVSTAVGTQARARARVVGHLPQAVRSDLALDVEQFVLMGRYPHADTWFESASDRSWAVQAMIECGCEALRGRRMSTLSGGERQRVLLAACLAQEPRLLLLDEPATFLDVDQQLQCFEMLRRRTNAGTACLAVTHDLNLALTYCTRMLVLADRTLAYDLPIDRALDDPGWLRAFSPRLTLTQTPAGRPWVFVR